MPAFTVLVGCWCFLALPPAVEAQAGGAGGGDVIGVCPPPAGTELIQDSSSTATLLVEVPGMAPVNVATQGAVVTREVAGTGIIQTEILSMALTGASPLGPVTVRLDPLRPPAPGAMRGFQVSDTGDCEAIDSFFDVFVEVTIDTATARIVGRNLQIPFHMIGQGPVPVVHSRPFTFILDPDQVATGVPLHDSAGQRVAIVRNVVHSIQPPGFKRGDANCDGCVDEKDARYIAEWLFQGGPPPCCLDAADANDDGQNNLQDTTFIANYAGGLGPPPPDPGPDKCGPDPTRDTLVTCDYPQDLCDLACPEESCFPPAGVDIMSSTLLHDIDIPGIGLCQANLSGPVKVQRSDPYVDPATGLQCIDTELVEMDLRGVDPVCGQIRVTIDPCFKSRGRICEKFPGTCFPADSFFDVFVKVELPDLGICLYACEPARMQCVIDRIPPFRCLYNLNVGAGQVVPLYRGPCAIRDCASQHPCNQQPRPAPAAFIVKAVHQPLPPDECDCFPPAGEDVMFTNLGHAIDIPGMNLTCRGFQGPIVVRRSDPYINADGLCCIDTEIVRMRMTGICSDGSPAEITLCPERPSKGVICAQEPGTCFPANSCFDVFFQVTITTPLGPVTFKNCKPAVMCCKIDALPPIGCPYQLTNAPIALYRAVPGAVSPCVQDPLPAPAGTLENASHTPEEDLGGGDPCCPEYGPGEDVLQTTLLHDIDIPGIGRCAANLRGRATVRRGVPYRDPLTGQCCVETEIVSLELVGADPVCGSIRIVLDPRRPSRGQICEKEPGTCFPAESCFDVFVRIELPDHGLVLVACDPARMCCDIDAIPPFGCLYNLDIGEGEMVPLYELPGAAVAPGAGGGGTPCVVPDDGTGTVRLPPEGCGYVSPEEVHMIIDGLPPGTTIEIGAEHTKFFNIQERPGGTLGGNTETFDSILVLNLQGTGDLAGFNRTLAVQVASEVHTGPRMPGDPVQSFPNDMFRLQGQLIGDPDFDLLRITGGTGNGLPSPGHTTLTTLPGGDWSVDSFFVIDYRIDFVGSPGGPLGGMSGSTTGTIRMQTGSGGGGPQPADPCKQVPRPNPRAFIVKAVHQPEPPCVCFPPAGDDRMDSELAHRIRVFGVGPGGDLICDADMHGPVVVRRSDPRVDPATGLCTIDTEIVELNLQGNDPNCGPVQITLDPNRPSRGWIREQAPDTCFPADSFFDVFIQVTLPDQEGLTLANCAPARMECVIQSIPPFNCVYILRLSDVPLYRAADCANLPDPAIQPVAIIEAARHRPIEPCDCPYGPGTDTMDSFLQHQFDLFGIGRVCTTPLRGKVVVERGAPFTNEDGLCCVSTRMVSLDLTGSDPSCGEVRIRLSPDRPSRGTICEQEPGTCFPADSCFDVFIEVEIPDLGLVLENCKPAVMCCKIQQLPPYGCVYRLDLVDVELFEKGACDDPAIDPPPQPVGVIRQGAEHRPLPCPPIVTCQPSAVAGSVVISWQPDPACQACERFRVTQVLADGTEVDIPVPAGQTQIERPCPPGEVVTYCVRCVIGGVESEPACCEVDCGDPCANASVQLDCQVNGNVVVLSWQASPDGCCQSFRITKNGAVVADNVTANTMTFDCAPGETATYCVECIDAAGNVRARDCCDVVCPRPCVIETSCDPTPNGIVVTWQLIGDCLCDRIEIRREDGTVLAEADPSTNSVTIPGDCREILGGVVGKICVVCVLPDGTEVEGCCDVRCPEEIPNQVPNDCNQDGTFDLSDEICLLSFLFRGRPRVLPCGDGSQTHPANVALLDCDGNGRLELTDAICGLRWRFLGTLVRCPGGLGPPCNCVDPRCVECIFIPECPQVCEGPVPPADTPQGPDDFFSAMQVNPVDDDGNPMGPPRAFFGPVRVEKGAPVLEGGHWVVPTRMTMLNMMAVDGSGATINLGATESAGKIISQQGPAGPFFPCDSFFDVFVDVDIPGMFSAGNVRTRVEAHNQSEVPGCDCYRTPENFHAENPGAGPNISGGHLPCPPGCPPQNCRKDPNLQPCP